MPDEQQCARCVTRVSWISLGGSALLAAFKGVTGILTGSRALTASALYSLNDVVSGVALIIGLRISTRPADKGHPYGHGRVEYIVCVFTSILILGAVVFLIADSVRLMLKGEHASPHWVALAVAIVSVVANEIVYRYNMCAAGHTNSPALLAHAKHHRADAVSSVAVVVAIVGGAMGYRFLDALVAIFEGVHLLCVSAEILHQGAFGLIDRAIDESDVSSIRRIVSGMPDVTRVKDIKTRRTGRDVWIDLYVTVAGGKTIAEVHAICGRIRQSIEHAIEHPGRINVICV